MVGGGSLSLPMAFQKSGNLLLGPVIMITVAIITEFCFRIHVRSARLLSPVNDNETKKGKDSFESVAAAAFGNKMYVFGAFLVTAMCFFGTVGYAVLLRDMLQPITSAIWKIEESGPSLKNNLTMLSVVFLATPLCTLQNLTALERFGAFSMLSVLILGSCIVFRSLQCNLGYLDSPGNWESFQLWPESWTDVLDAFPLYVSCFVCHYNLLPVHNELQRPSAKRVNWWLRSTTWIATIFYLVMGVAGSAYGHCTAEGKVQGNVLLDFPSNDPLLMVGRMCLAITLTMAFPMLTIPGRDILLRSVSEWWNNRRRHQPSDTSGLQSLEEALLENDNQATDEEHQEVLTSETDTSITGPASVKARLAAAVLVLWSAAAVASFCESIDIVWDLLGSSLSCLLSYLIPCGSFLVIASSYDDVNDVNWLSRSAAKLILIVSIPLMIISTINAIFNTFFHETALALERATFILL
jgi:amino acid permease